MRRDPTSALQRSLSNFYWQVFYNRLPCAAAITLILCVTTGCADQSVAQEIVLGSKDPTVSEIQNILGVEPTGIYGPTTAEAVRRFQRQHKGLPINGVVGPDTLKVLRSVGKIKTIATPNKASPLITGGIKTGQENAGLRLGNRGYEVSELQQQLRNLGYNVNVNGKFDSLTDRAIRQFQTSNGLMANGIVGSATRNFLYNGVNASYPDPTYPTYSSDGDQVGTSRKRYVVVVPIDSGATVLKVRQYVSTAFQVADKRGSFINAGEFSDYHFAKAQSEWLRSLGFDAQVNYR